MSYQRPSACAYLIGAGSFTLGVEAAGVDIQAVHETPGYSKNAASWDLNRPDMLHNVLELDETPPESWADVDLVFSNAPCGGVSQVHNYHDSREGTNSCMLKVAKMAALRRPRTFLLESGYQLVHQAKHKEHYDQLVAILESVGYHVWNWQFFTWQLGGPQIRRRCFVAASLDKPDMEIVHAPLPVLYKHTVNAPSFLLGLPTEMSDNPKIPSVGMLDGVSSVYNHGYDAYGRRLQTLLERYPIMLKPGWISDADAAKLAVGTVKQREQLNKAIAEGRRWYDTPNEYNKMTMFRRPRRVPWQGPSPGVVSDYTMIHPATNRYLTMRELARLMGYPDHWRFHNNRPNLVAQGIPTWNAKWASSRLLESVGIVQRDLVSV